MCSHIMSAVSFCHASLVRSGSGGFWEKASTCAGYVTLDQLTSQIPCNLELSLLRLIR
jgi:hypothetical protein